MPEKVWLALMIDRGESCVVTIASSRERATEMILRSNWIGEHIPPDYAEPIEDGVLVKDWCKDVDDEWITLWTSPHGYQATVTGPYDVDEDLGKKWKARVAELGRRVAEIGKDCDA